VQTKVKSVSQYLAGLPADRRKALEAVRAVVLKNLPEGYEEGMTSTGIGYFVPHSVYPPGYHCDPSQPLPFAGIASQKNHMAIYLMCIYSHPEHEAWFREAWAKTGKKLDMGKSCVRFKKLEDVPLPVIGKAIKRVPVKKFIAFYESVIPANRRRATGAKPPASRAKRVAEAPHGKASMGKSARPRGGAAASKVAAKRKT